LNAFVTVIVIAAVAAITAAILAAAGVGDDNPPSSSEMTTREEQINRFADALAAEAVRYSRFCDLVTGPRSGGTGGFLDVTIDLQPLGGSRVSDLSDLTETEGRLFSDRFAEALREECEAR
jgi:hypothetical protein